jgi:hypothetical protein
MRSGCLTSTDRAVSSRSLGRAPSHSYRIWLRRLRAILVVSARSPPSQRPNGRSENLINWKMAKHIVVQVCT